VELVVTLREREREKRDEEKRQGKEGYMGTRLGCCKSSRSNSKRQRWGA
jgi:hypothetical protein